MAVQVDATENRRFEIRAAVELPAGQDTITIKLPVPIPAGKKGLVRIEGRIAVVDA